MFHHLTPTSSTPTPGSSSSSNNTLEPATTISTHSSSSQLHQQHQQLNHSSSLSASASNSSTQSYTQQQQQQQQHHLPNQHQHLQQQHQNQQQQQHHSQQQMSNINSNTNSNSRPPSRTPSILDSPTLARVERARLRLEASAHQQQQQKHHLQQQQQQQQQHQYQNHHHYHLSPQQQPKHQQQQQRYYNFNGSCGSGINTLNRADSLERSIMDPKQKDVPWHQVWTHMKRLSHTSKVNSTTTLCAPTTDMTNTGKSILFPDKTSSLRESLRPEQVVFTRPDMQSLLAGRIPVASMTGPIKRGLLWQQRDRLFSRWKERYFVLTRDYLHCFKRASGSANERASDMGQFIFKIKLVDVEKVEWLNRRSYSVIGLLLGREGRVLLRCDEGLEDWFELLEECTITSKQRRHALKITQSPRSRASLAAPISHATLQSNHYGLGGNYSSALDDWLMSNRNGMAISRHQKLAANSVTGYGNTNPFLFSDSVPDLSNLNNENHNHSRLITSNHSTPMKIPYSSAGNINNSSRYSNGYASQNASYSNVNGGGGGGGSGVYGSPRRIFINSSFGSTQVVDEEANGDEGDVELRRPRIFRQMSSEENGNELDRNGLYRKPRAPTDMRHSAQPVFPVRNNNTSSKLITDLDYSGHDSGLDTPPSTANRPNSYRRGAPPPTEVINNHHNEASSRDSSETSASSSRGTMLNSPVGSFRNKHLHQMSNLNRINDLHGSRQSVQERILKLRNGDEDRCNSIKSNNRMNSASELYDNNLNPYRDYKSNGNQSPRQSLTPQHTPVKSKYLHPHPQMNGGYGGNNNGSLNSNARNGSAIFRERCQHPAVAAIMNGA